MTSTMSCSFATRLLYCITVCTMYSAERHHLMVIKLSALFDPGTVGLSIEPSPAIATSKDSPYTLLSMTRPRVGIRGCGQPNFSALDLAVSVRSSD